jgi:uncharacterized protein involved in exopolysaccharide biosynthesis
MNYPKTESNQKSPAPATVRDYVAILFRQRRVAVIAFAAIFVGTAVFTFLKTDRYTARMLILVENSERADPVVSAQPNAPPDLRFAVTEEEMNSELELLQSRDLLQEVAITCGLDSPHPSRWNSLFRGAPSSRDERISRAVAKLASKLNEQVVKRSNVIQVSYSSGDPQLAAQVLRTLADLYLKKNAAVHRPSGAVDFFGQEEDQYRQSLQQAQAQLVRFTRSQGVVSATYETEAALRQLNDFEAMQTETQAAIAQARRRVQALEAQQSAISPRMTTAVKTSDNPQLIEQLKTTLLNLELKRTELLGKFAPDYRPVKELETQIEQAKAAMASAERAPWKEETTDRDPNFELVREELTKARGDLAGLEARGAALQRAVQTYQAKALWLKQQGVEQENLIRTAKAAEDNYLLYQRKHEEARITDALDTHRIMNVRVAEAATVPVLPVHPNSWYFLVATMIATVGSLGLAFIADFLDPTLRTPSEVEAFLDIPVVATMPRKGNGDGKANGDGNAKGATRIHVS